MKEENLRRNIGVGCVSLYVNRNANMWADLIMYLSRELKAYSYNIDPNAPIETVVLFIIPGYNNPVEFFGTRITIKSRKGSKRVQVEAAVPDMPFPRENPEIAKKIVLDLMLQSIEEVEDYGRKIKIISDKLHESRNIVSKAWKKWNVSDFKYEIPEGLPYFDLPKVNEYTTRRFIEQLSNGNVRHYNMVLDKYGSEVM